MGCWLDGVDAGVDLDESLGDSAKLFMVLLIYIKFL